METDLKELGVRWAFLVFIFTASAGAAWLYRWRYASPDDDDVINTSTFSAFTIINREQVSPTAFIITLRPSAWVDPEELGRGGVDDELPGFLSARISEAWRHGLWSVEIKQPQLQIARHYTPLPPLSAPETSVSLDNEQDFQPDLRILVRRMDGGEMSNYLSRKKVGDTVWLRGPHFGFDISRRLGNHKVHDGDTRANSARGQRRVVFLAGGTGIAPALQVAHKLLDSPDSGDIEGQPHISILWANRWGADAVGRESLTSPQTNSPKWFQFWDRVDKNSSATLKEKPNLGSENPGSSLAHQIHDLKRRHPSQFKISYFVDDESRFIQTQDIEGALASTPLGTSDPRESPSTYAAITVELLPDDNDSARSSSSDPACACSCAPKTKAELSAGPPDINLIGVSGPDGFIEAYAGAKRWHDGGEMQGAIRGLLGRILNDQPVKAGNWLVLKL
ncbi:hypothetical protein F4777DRAFT_589477 [Nemania sp. FL0916]|nr:hypothetical protein F4777DRAFT_589477 [Nemania sp. FL0916]